MRYFLLGWLLIVVVGVSIAGFRGDLSRHAPFEIFPDMKRQPKLKPQKTSRFFADGRSSRLPVPGAIAQTGPYEMMNGMNQAPVFPYEDVPFNTGREAGATNFVETLPVSISLPLLHRGRERYDIFCAPCHSPVGDGNSAMRKLGMTVVANLHEERFLQMTDGELFHVISDGRGLMGPYAALIDVEDRWAVIAYLRALQRSRLGDIEDVPAPLRAQLQP
jgi:hypothetical protein